MKCCLAHSKGSGFKARTTKKDEKKRREGERRDGEGRREGSKVLVYQTRIEDPEKGKSPEICF